MRVLNHELVTGEPDFNAYFHLVSRYVPRNPCEFSVT
jgi:hypothetical protein